MLSNALSVFEKLFAIESIPCREYMMLATVRSLFQGLGFRDYPLPKTVDAYEPHPRTDFSGQQDRLTPNLALSFKGDAKQPHFVFNAHLDHYPLPLAKTYTIDGQIMRGDGTGILGADCKMGIAQIYAICSVMVEMSLPPSIDVIFDTCEEHGLIGMTEFVVNRHYQMLPFYETYKKGGNVLAYAFDGDVTGNKVHVSFSSFLIQQLIKRSPNMLDIKNGKIISRRWGKRERTLSAALSFIGSNSDGFYKYGVSATMLNKCLPTVLLTNGSVDFHTVQETCDLKAIQNNLSLFRIGMENMQNCEANVDYKQVLWV